MSASPAPERARAAPGEPEPVRVRGARPAGASESPEPEISAAGTQPIRVANRYLLGAELGRGGMGRVVEAYDQRLGRAVAFKEVLASSGVALVQRFAREVQLTARLEHPSIVPLYDAGVTADGRPYYVMRRVSGRPLDQLIARLVGLGGRLTLLPALLAAIDAVAHAHRRGVIHRDLKPANILVGDLGETVVIDWGLAKLIGEDDPASAGDAGPAVAAGPGSPDVQTQLGSVFGTPGFMAPEQARGEPLDPRSDVYALGATLYQLLAGAPPHAGTSASEVIARTGTREVAPVASAAPGAPPELVAIVDKALAFKPDARYTDASALGEDVRRFLDGRLVGAHQYTRRQRIARFARQHRGALSVAGLAVVAVAVLAGVSVRRIVDERDAANRARAAAAADQATAERANRELQRRADQLIVMQARGLVDKNPTHSLAVLKELDAGSARLDDARAVAQAASVRGAAWLLPAPSDPVVYAELSADAARLVHATRDGTVRIWDLDRRRLVTSRRYPPLTRALWTGARLLVIPPAAAPEIFDPGRDVSEPLALGPISQASATAAGDRVVFVDRHGRAGVLDVASGSHAPLWPAHQVAAVAIAPDGRWVAAADGAALVVLDPAGRELSARRDAVVRLTVSRAGALAYATGDKLAMSRLESRPVWRELDLRPLRPHAAIDQVFAGDDLHIYMTHGKVMVWDGNALGERLQLAGLAGGLVEGYRDLVIAPGLDDKLHFANRLVSGALHLPVPLRHSRLYARASAPRIVAVGAGVIAGFDLGDSLPEDLGALRGAIPTFVDDDTLLLWHSLRGTARWYDVSTRAATEFEYEPRGIPYVIDVDPGDGRVVMGDRTDDVALVTLRKHTGEQVRIARGPAAWGRLLPRGALVYAIGDGRLFARIGDAPAREIARLDGIADHAVGLGGTRFAAISTTGEVVRGDLAGGALERVRIPQAPGAGQAAVMVARDEAGRVLIGCGDRLLIWDRELAELARPGQPILRIAPVPGGAMLELADHSLVRAALVPGSAVRPLLAASSQPVLVSADGKLAIGRTVNGQVVVVESGEAVWDLPVYFAGLDIAAISPRARRFVQTGFGRTALWTLPRAPVELRPWLDERTNAVTDDEHALTWPRSPADR